MLHDWYCIFLQAKNNLLFLGSIFASKMYVFTRCKSVDLVEVIERIVLSGSGYYYNNVAMRCNEDSRGKV